MAAVPLLETKLHVPSPRRGAIPRPRLQHRLAIADLPAITLVSAPAGFGKTTVLAEWAAAAARSAQVAWVSLDVRDNDPHLFWSYVVAALRPVTGGAAAELLHNGDSISAVVATLLNEVGRTASEVALVLDDYHVVESVEVHEWVRFLVEHAPPQLHLVLASRADPPWPFARLRARGDLLELRSAELRFSSDEAAAYLAKAGVILTPAQVDALESRTEGWIAALQLAALSLEGRDDVGAFIAGFAGDDRFILDYLVDEVLVRVPPSTRRFLLHTSVLGRLTAELCDAVTAEPVGKALLDVLDRANLFLVPLDDRRAWYRYHHLFAEFLQARLLDEEPALVPVLHGRASEWYEHHGDRAEAVAHAIASGDLVRAAELIELALPAMRQARQEATLRAWYSALPRELLDDRPVLAMGLVGARMSSGLLDGVPRLLDAVEQRLAAAAMPRGPAVVVVDHGELPRLPTQVAMFRAALALLGGDPTETLTYAGRALEMSADDDFGRGAASALLGLAHWTLGELGEAERRYAESVACFIRVEHHADVLGCARALADIQSARGRLGPAMRTLESGLERARTHAPLRGTADMHAGLSELFLERNALALARTHAETSAELGDRLALPQNAYRWRVVLARLLQIDGDHLGTLEFFQEAEAVYDTDFSPSIKPVPAAAARAHLAVGELAAARHWATTADIGVDDRLSYLREYEHLTLVRLLLAEHAAEPGGSAASDALDLTERLLAAATAGQRERSVIEVLVLRALAHAAAGDEPSAIASLDDALDRAAVEGYLRVFLDEGAPLLAVLETAAERRPAGEHARRLLATETALDEPTRRLPARPPVLVDELSARELDVLRLLRSDLSGPDIARELTVSLNTLRTHTKSIYMKLAVNSRRAAVRRAAELGL